jgi:hypothetical protein
MSVFAKPANIVVPVLLFILLTPGLFITLPEKRTDLWTKTLVHAVVFGLVYTGLRYAFKTYY